MNPKLHAVSDLADHLLSGYAWGLGALDSDRTITDTGELKAYRAQLPGALYDECAAMIGKENAGAELIGEVDAFVDRYAQIEDLREYLVDLALLRLISDGSAADEEQDYFESPGWLAIEDATTERGTEVLNLLVYIKDCRENQVEPGLGDFLNEFLLVGDDQFQDEFFIYEEVIRNQGLLEGDVAGIIAAGNAQRDPDMQELFTPLMLFFKDKELKHGKCLLAILNESRTPGLHAGIYNLLNRFYLIEESQLLN